MARGEKETACAWDGYETSQSHKACGLAAAAGHNAARHFDERLVRLISDWSGALAFEEAPSGMFRIRIPFRSDRGPCDGPRSTKKPAVALGRQSHEVAIGHRVCVTHTHTHTHVRNQR